MHVSLEVPLRSTCRRAEPDVTVQVGSRNLPVKAETLDRDEGADIFARCALRHRLAAKYLLPRLMGFPVRGWLGGSIPHAELSTSPALLTADTLTSPVRSAGHANCRRSRAGTICEPTHPAGVDRGQGIALTGEQASTVN